MTPKPPARKPKWNGLCPEGEHGLDFEGQDCDLCPVECSLCAGTGIGQFGDPDTSKCIACKGRGVRP